jgi:putative addiction module component (TIGR02574 family)
MKTELLLDRFSVLPDNLQEQVLDYIEFLIDRYSELTNVESDQNEPEEISPELKALLDERIAEHEKNPQAVCTWEEIEEEFDKKYGYAV